MWNKRAYSGLGISVCPVQLLAYLQIFIEAGNSDGFHELTKEAL
jgi:hypothetical protein